MRIKNLFEAEVKPGERKGMSLKIKKLETLAKKIEDYQSSASTFGNAKVPDSVAAEYEKVKQGIFAEIETLTQQKSSIKDEKNKLPAKFFNLMKGIEKNCSQIFQFYMDQNKSLSTYDPAFFYRGIKRTSDDALYGKPFDNRRVMTSDSTLNDIFNKKMAEAGFTARRDNSTFVSRSRNQASNYGALYVVFPRDGFSFTYSKNVKDLVLGSDHYGQLLDYEVVKPLVDYIKQHQEELKPFHFHFSNLSGQYSIEGTLRSAKRAIEAGSIPEEFLPLTEMENIITAKSVVDGFQLDNTDLKGALDNAGEVLIHGAYYAVKIDLIKDIMKYFEQRMFPDGRPKTKNEYNIGDRVTIINKNDINYGKSGEVTHVYISYNEVSVKIDGSNITKDYKFKTVKHEGAEDDEETVTFQNGDRVEVTNVDSEYYGKVGIVSNVGDDNTVGIYFQGGEYGVVNGSYLSLVKDDGNTKVPVKGEMVKIVGNHEDAGKTGKVHHVFSWHQDVTVELADGDYIGDVPFSNLETLTGNSVKDIMPGVKIKIIGDHPKAGTTGEVTSVFVNSEDLDMRTDDGKLIIDVPFANVEILKTDEKPKDSKKFFAEFDKVKIIGDHPSAGKIGTIEHVWTSYDNKFDVELDHGVIVSKVSGKNLELIDDKQGSANSSPFSEGDKVKIIGDVYGSGLVCTVYDLFNDSKSATLVTDDDDHAMIPDVEFINMEKISSADKEPDLNIDDLKWEEEPEVNTPPAVAAHPFKLGDKVKIKDDGIHFPGSIGTITNINTGGANVQIGPDEDDTSFFYYKELEKLPDEPQSHGAEQEPELDQGPPPEMKPVNTNFKIKDSVKVLTGKHAGQIGVITYLSAAWKFADVNLNGHEFKMPFSNLELADNGATEEKPAPITADASIVEVPSVKSMIENALKIKRVTFEQMDAALPVGTTSAQIEELFAKIESLGIEIVDNIE